MAIRPGNRVVSSTVDLDTFHVSADAGSKFLRVKLEPEGDISITTERGVVQISFDEFRANYFAMPTPKRYVHKRGYFSPGAAKYVEKRDDGYWIVNRDGTEYKDSHQGWCDQHIADGTWVEYPVIKRYVPKKGYFNESRFRCVEQRGDEWFYIYFGGDERKSNFRVPWDRLINEGRMIRGEMRRFRHVTGFADKTLAYVEFGPLGGASVHYDGSRGFCNCTDVEEAERFVTRGSWVEL